MTENTSGEILLRKQLDQFLDDFNARIALHEKQVPLNDLNNFININLEEIKTSDADYCFEVSVALTQYAFFLQRVINKERAFVQAAENKINIVCAREWSNYHDKNLWKPESILRQQIINGDQFLRELNRIVGRSKSIIQDTYGLVQLVQKAADQWKDMGKVKSYGSR